MIDINSLRRLAQAATPGPWEFWHGMIATDIDNDGGVVIANRPTPSGGKLQARVDTNFQYIVAANPAAITELLDRLEAAEKERDELRARIEAMEKQEPVAWVDAKEEGYEFYGISYLPVGKHHLYAAPVSAKMQGDCTLAEPKCSNLHKAPY